MAFSKHWFEEARRKGLVIEKYQPLPDDISEKEFQSEVIRVAKRCGWIVHHHLNSIGSEAGWPDLCLLHTGRAKSLFVELKTNTGPIRHDQQVIGQAMVQTGLDWRIWRPAMWSEIVRTLEQP